MGTITTSQNPRATGVGSQRKIDRIQNGVLWSLIQVYGATPLALAYSTDNGATWTTGGAVANGGGGSTGGDTTNADFYIDLDDFAHLVQKDGDSGFIYYRRGTPNATRTAYTWSAATLLSSTTAHDHPSLVAHRQGSGWAVHVVFSRTDNTAASKAIYVLVTVSSSGVVSAGGATGIGAGPNAANANSGFPSIEFNHTGDGKTVKDGAPHLYVAWSDGATGAGDGIRFMKATYAAGAWTWGTEREIDNAFYFASAYSAPVIFDGTRVVIAGVVTNGTTIRLIAHDRDPADPASGGTTQRTLLDNPSGANILVFGSTTYDSSGNLYLFGADRSAADGTQRILYRKWTRATATLETAIVFDATGNNLPYVSARRGSQGQAIDYVWTDGTASPYAITSGRIVLNQNPTAATPLTPADNATIDSSTDQPVTFQPNDPDGDAATAWRIRYRPAGTTVGYAYLTGSTTAANGATVTATVPAGAWTGQPAWEPQTYDSSNAEGAWGAVRVVTGRPAALAALTGGQGGTSMDADDLYTMVQSERALRALNLV